jgi:uncharacterized protein
MSPQQSRRASTPVGSTAVIRPSALIEVRQSKLHGNGVFATQHIAGGQTIEVCPALVFDEEQWELTNETVLHGYFYEAPDGQTLLALGYGSLYNHAEDPSAEYEVETSPPCVTVTAARTIMPGEEVTIRYGRAEDLWFTLT